MTYGRLIGQAKQLLHQTLNDYSMHTTVDALVVCAARARLYRVLAGALALHLDPPRAAEPRQFLQYRGDGIKPREATLLHQLREDLLTAAQQPAAAGSHHHRTPQPAPNWPAPQTWPEPHSTYSPDISTHLRTRQLQATLPYAAAVPESPPATQSR
jgi:hypothetical protein